MFLLVTVVILLYLALVTAGQMLRTYQLRQEEARLKDEVALLEAKNQSLLAQKDYYASDAYVEKSARENLNLIKPGETAVIILPPPGPTPGVSAPSASQNPDRLSWQRWWDLFFGQE